MSTFYNYDAVIFDVDGTLLDTTEGLLEAVQYTIEHQQLPAIDRQTILTFIGPPIQDSFQRVYGFEGEYLQELATIFRNYYSDKALFKAIPYQGIYEVCDELKRVGVRMAVATYKRQDYAINLLKYFHFDRYSDILYGADHQNKLKKTDIIQKCIDDMGRPGKVLMVGDSWHDEEGARQAGIDFVGVTYGFGFKTKSDVEAFQAVGYADKPCDLLKIIGGDYNKYEG